MKYGFKTLIGISLVVTVAMVSGCVTTPMCGNGLCETGENLETCPNDCPETSEPMCGNGVCESDENSYNCPDDCIVFPDTIPDPNEWVGWSRYEDNHGFSVYMPHDWSFEVEDTGLIKIGENLGQDTGAIAFIWTISLKEQMTEEALFDDIVSSLITVFPELEVASERHVSSYGAYVGAIEYGEYMGVIMLSINGMNAQITGFGALKDQYNESLDNLIRILYSFEYEPDLMDPVAVGMVQMVEWTDPTEGAFTIDVPKDWVISDDSGITRPYIDASVKIVASEGNMGISIEQLRPPLYYTPNAVLDQSGYTEGSSYGGGIVLSYYNAEQYIQDILSTTFSSAPEYVTDRSDIISSVYSAPWVVDKTAAETSFIENGIVYNILVGDEYYELAGIGMWAVSMIYYWAPEADIELVAKVANEMMLSFDINETWAANEQQQVAIRTGLINALGDDIANIVQSTFEYRDSIMDDASRKFSNAILGINDVYNPETAEQWTVSSGSEHYWQDIYGDIWGTGTYTPPTYSDDWQELYCHDC